MTIGWRRHVALAAVAALALIAPSVVIGRSSGRASAAPSAQSAGPGGAQSTFRASVDVTLLDVTVLDSHRRPVRGLTANDFTVLVDGQPRPVVSFEAVNLAPPPAPAAAWIRDAPQDVVTNTVPSSRLVVILIDDGSQLESGDLWSVNKTREVARTVVDQLGPDDTAAVLFTASNRSAQAFTRDHVRLKTAIDKAAMFPAPRPGGPGTDPGGPVYDRGDCYCGLCSIDAIRTIAEALRDVPGQRKLIVYVSVGPYVIVPALGREAFETACQSQKQDALNDSFRAAQLANVTVQTIDPQGLMVGNPVSEYDSTVVRVQALQAIAENTGGRAVVRDNDMERAVPALLDETSSFYLLGVDAGPARDGSFRPIRVQVNRPDVEVRTRKGIYATTAKERAKAQAAAVSVDAGLNAALNAPFPKSGIPLDVAVAPFLEPGPDRRSALAMAVNIHPDSSEAGSDTEQFTLVAAAFVPESGSGAGERRQTVTVRWPEPRRADKGFELLSRMPLAPGRYELRLAVEGSNGRTGTVQTYVEVPKFKDDALALSGLVLLTPGRGMLAPPDAFDDLLPEPLTARRSFDDESVARAFMRVYQLGAREPEPITARLRIVDSADVERASNEVHLDTAAFTESHSADVVFDLPLASLTAGDYLLTVDVTAKDRTQQRTIRFSRR